MRPSDRSSGWPPQTRVQFSLLEVADTRARVENVKRRERHWKRVLGSHVHGYNKNL